MSKVKRFDAQSQPQFRDSVLVSLAHFSTKRWLVEFAYVNRLQQDLAYNYRPTVSTMAGGGDQSEGSHLELLRHEKAARSVVISNISAEIGKDEVMIYFQKKQIGGGEVD